ncbi:MAG TPA: TIGR03619 family F420-dependent LLM class oxidoreductase [Acidimicrobiia bacterium]|nr:TIGR03619 family F420-dependent LLM class oxidoreductase [Acidimicrobiia bacterium]
MADRETRRNLRFGFRIPSYAPPGLSYQRSRALLDYCRRVDALPYDDIWVIDHLLVSKGVYGVSWLDAITTLSAAAAVTERVGLGTAALVLPLRHPVILAKEIASLHMLSGGRFRLGVAVGWDPDEFAAVGIALKERGKRTDEALELIRLLLTEEEVTFEGRFWQVEDLTIYPRVPVPPPVWIAGGTLTHAPDTPDKPFIAAGVLDRILHADGWMARSSGSDPGDVQNDWEVVQEHLTSHGRDPATLTFSATQFLHVVEDTDRERALDQQMPHFLEIMGGHRTAEDLQASYLTGTIDDMLETVTALRVAGLQYLILTPLVEDPHQVELITRHIVEPLS